MENNKFTDRQIEIIEAATLRIDKHGIQELTIKNLAADLGLSEAALYRHFKSKHDIMLGLLSYFIFEMKERLAKIMSKEKIGPTEKLKEIFASQLKTFTDKPAIVSVIFSEGIFQFNKEFIGKLSEIMDLMQGHIQEIINKGQQEGVFSDMIGPSTTATIIMGSMRITVLKWKMSGHTSNLIKEGNTVLAGLLKMLKK